MIKLPAEYSYEELKNRPCEELAELLALLPRGTPAKTLTAFSRRLYEIALIDNYVDRRNRTNAWNLAQAAHEALEENMSGNTHGIELLRQARQSQFETARIHGVGSLSWKLKEENISNANTVSYVMAPFNRALVSVFFQTLPKQLLDGTRHHFIKELLSQNDCGMNDEVLILYSLTLRDDPALRALLTDREYKLLASTPQKYADARSALVESGLLTRSSVLAQDVG